jgi:hypothetical protein
VTRQRHHLFRRSTTKKSGPEAAICLQRSQAKKAAEAAPTARRLRSHRDPESQIWVDDRLQLKID